MLHIPRIESKEIPETTVCIEDPKYFEQAVSDYSDVVRLLQKVHPGYRIHRFFVIYNLVRVSVGKRKKRPKQNYKKEPRSGKVYLKRPL